MKKTMNNGTTATLSALLNRLARMPVNPLTISFWMSNASKVKIAISASDVAVVVVTIVVVVVVTVVTMEACLPLWHGYCKLMFLDQYNHQYSGCQVIE
jgi:hypothetical protein